MLSSSVEELTQVAVVLVLVSAIDHNVVCDATGSLAFLQDAVHLQLEDVLADLQAKG